MFESKGRWHELVLTRRLKACRQIHDKTRTMPSILRKFQISFFWSRSVLFFAIFIKRDTKSAPAKKYYQNFEFIQKSTLMVSKGCPLATQHTPPIPPARKFFIPDVLLVVFSVVPATATSWSAIFVVKNLARARSHNRWLVPLKVCQVFLLSPHQLQHLS